MSDLHGEDAFDRVLDRMVEAEKRAAIAEERLRSDDRDNKIALLQRDLNNARSDVAAHVAAQADAMPKLHELYNAADETRRYVRDGIAIDLGMERLRKALEAAREHCDQVPF